MQELREQDLILYYYGEARNAEAIRRRLDASPAERERYGELCRLLELADAQPVPEPHADYGARVWRRLRPRLEEQPPGSHLREWLGAFFAPRRLAAAGTLAMLLAVAFAAGRYWPAISGEADQPSLAVLSQAGRERILLISVGEHLERSEMLLIELANTPSDGAPDLGDEPRRAEQLLADNRLYRQAARRSGQPGIAEVLDELERLLLDIAHSGDLSAADLDELQQRIEGGGILFRVQVIGSRVQLQKPITRPPDASGEV